MYKRQVLEQIAEQPNVLIEELEIATEEECGLILGEFNNTKAEYPKDKTVVELFEEQVERTPENIALIYEEKELTYHELNTRANQVAWKLRELEVGPDDFVAIIAQRSIEMIVGIYGIIKAGGAYVPIDPTYPDERIKYMLRDCKPKALLLYQAEIETEIPIIDLENSQVFVGMSENPERVNKPEDLVYCIYTSGTTGNPKGVLIENKGILSMQKYLCGLYKINDSDNILQFSNYVFDASVWEMTISLLSGATLCLIPSASIRDIMKFNEYVEIHNISITLLPPKYFLQTGITKLKVLTTGGSEASFDIINRVSNDIRYINAYGPTENTVLATHWRCV